jgi:hypothetical protein
LFGEEILLKVNNPFDSDLFTLGGTDEIDATAN